MKLWKRLVGVLALLCLSTGWTFLGGSPPAKAAPAPTAYDFVGDVPFDGLPVEATQDAALGEIIARDNAGNLLLLSATAGTLTVLRTLLATPPEQGYPDLAISSDGREAYMIDGANQIAAVALYSNPSQDHITPLASDPYLPEYLTVGVQGEHLWIVNASGPGGAPASLSVLDLANDTLSPAQPLPGFSLSAAVTARDGNGGTVAFVGTGSDGHVERWSWHNGWQNMGALSTVGGAAPQSLAISPSGTLYIADSAGAIVALANATASTAATAASLPPLGEAVSMEAEAMTVGPHGTLYALGAMGDLLVYPASGPATLRSAALSAPLSMAGNGTATAVTATGIAQWNGATGPFATDTLENPIVANPQGYNNVAIAPDGQTAYLAGEQAVSAYNLTDQRWTATVPIVPGAGGIALSPDGGTLFVAGAGSSITAVTLASGYQTLSSLPAGESATALTDTGGGLAATITDGTQDALWIQESTVAAVYNVPGSTVSMVYAGGLYDIGEGGGGILPVSASGYVGTAIPDAAGALAMAAVPGGSSLYVANGVAPPDLSIFPLTSTGESGSWNWSLPDGQSVAPPVIGLAFAPNGQTLYVDTSNGLLIYGAPMLSLSAATSTPTVGTPDPVTASLLAGGATPIAGVPIAFSNGTTVTTNVYGTASTVVTALNPGPSLLTAEGDGAQASLTVNWQAAPSAPPVVVGGGGGGSPLTWEVTVTVPNNNPTGDSVAVFSDAAPPALSLPSGAVQDRFMLRGVSQGELLTYYPVRYTLSVIPPSDFTGPFSVWYYSPNFGAWYPLFPSRQSNGAWQATAPYLSQFAIVNVPTPSPYRIAGADRIGTANAMAALLFPNGAQNVVLANAGFGGAAPPDALSATPLAGALRAPLLLTQDETLAPATLNTMKALGARIIYVMGGTNAVGAGIRTSLAADGYTVVSDFSGIDRFHTSYLIACYLANHHWAAPQRAYVANGWTMADALSLGGLAANTETPILLSDGSGLIARDAAWLNTQNVTHVVVAGGPAAVSNAVLTSLQASGIQTTRYGGKDREATAILLDGLWQPSPQAPPGVVLASDGSQGALADAVVAGTFSWRYRVPLLLVPAGSLGPEDTAFLSAHPPLWQVLTGGPKSLLPEE